MLIDYRITPEHRHILPAGISTISVILERSVQSVLPNASPSCRRCLTSSRPLKPPSPDVVGTNSRTSRNPATKQAERNQGRSKPKCSHRCVGVKTIGFGMLQTILDLKIILAVS